MGDWFVPVLSGLLCGAAYLCGRYHAKVKRLDCTDAGAVKSVFKQGEITPLLESENGDLYKPNRCIVVLDGGKPLMYGVAEIASRLKPPCFENYIEAVVDMAATNGVSKEDTLRYMAEALTRHYDMPMEDKQYEAQPMPGVRQ